MATSSSLTILMTIWPGVIERRELPGHDRLGLHLIDEVTHHVERHVRLEQRAADFAHRLADVALGKRTATRQLVENAGQAI